MFVTQATANEIMENPIANLGQSYGGLINIFYFCLFYSFLIPSVIFCGLIQIIIYYFIDKYNIFNRRSIKFTFSSELSNFMIDLLEFGLVIMNVGTIYFNQRFSDHLIGDADKDVYTLVGVLSLVSLLFFLMPTEYIFYKLTLLIFKK